MSVPGKGDPDSAAGTPPAAPGEETAACTAPAPLRPCRAPPSAGLQKTGSRGQYDGGVQTGTRDGPWTQPFPPGSHPGKQRPPSAQFPRAAGGRFGSCRPFQLALPGPPHLLSISTVWLGTWGTEDSWSQWGCGGAGSRGAGTGEREGLHEGAWTVSQKGGWGGGGRSCGGRRMCPGEDSAAPASPLSPGLQRGSRRGPLPAPPSPAVLRFQCFLVPLEVHGKR